MNRSSIAWKSAGNFNNSFRRIQTFFRRFSLAPSDFVLFPKMKIKLKGRRFDTVEEIGAEMQTVLNTLTKKNTSRMNFKGGRNAPKGTTLKVLVHNKMQVRCNSFY
jgi:hypothetical protein